MEVAEQSHLPDEKGHRDWTMAMPLWRRATHLSQNRQASEQAKDMPLHGYELMRDRGYGRAVMSEVQLD